MNNVNANRYVDFLRNYTYYANSVGFRIVSSAALEKWKNVQAFQLNQISNGKFTFQRYEKEILLLQYDLWSRWLIEVENLFIEICNERSRDLCSMSAKEVEHSDAFPAEPVRFTDTACSYDSVHDEILVTSNDVDAILKLATKVNEVFEAITRENYPGRFPRDYMDTRAENHKIVLDLFRYKMRGMVGLSFEAAFIAIADLATRYLQFNLLELHEMNALFKYVGQGHPADRPDSLPFLTYSELDDISLRLKGECLITKRFDNYRRRYGITNVYIKNYSACKVPVDVFQRLEEDGAIIEYKMNY